MRFKCRQWRRGEYVRALLEERRTSKKTFGGAPFGARPEPAHHLQTARGLGVHANSDAQLMAMRVGQVDAENINAVDGSPKSGVQRGNRFSNLQESISRAKDAFHFQDM